MVQAPIDLVGSVVLGVLLIALQGRFPVCLPNGHRELPCLYIVPIALPSERKSGVIETILRPLIEYEKDYNKEHDKDVAQNESEMRLTLGRIAKAEREVINSKSSDERQLAEQELSVANTELAAFEKKSPLRLFGADVTPEKLAAMLKSQGGVFALVSAEGGGVFENIGRYSDKGGLEIYLNGYSGDRITVDRKTSDSIIVERPILNLLLPCQPSVITDLFSDSQKAGRGLLSRMLFVKCNSLVGGRKATACAPPNECLERWDNLVKALAADKNSEELKFDEDGFSVYTSFFDEIEPQLTPDSVELEFMADWAGKLCGNMVRLAGLIHCISERTWTPLITRDEALCARELALYFLAHAKAVYLSESESRESSNARYLWRKLKDGESFTKRELIRKTSGKCNFNLDESLAALAARGYLRIDIKATKGRKAELIVINPEAKR
jgi:hypothetical protein